MRHEIVTRAYFKWNVLPIKVAGMLRLQGTRHDRGSDDDAVRSGYLLCEDMCVWVRERKTENK